MLRHAIVGAGATVLEMHRPAFSLPTTQIVVVMTPHPYHAEIAIAALEAGCHVLWSSPAAHPFPVDLPPGEADHAAVYRDLHAAILDGTPLSSDGVQGRLSLELANAITLSSRRGRAVDLPLDRAEYAALLHELRTPTR